MLIRYIANNNKAMGDLTYFDLLDQSLEGLMQFVDPDEVEVYCFPPQNHPHADKIRDMGITVKVRPWHPLTKLSRYAFKLYMYEDIPDDLIICDADTLVYNDPHRLIESTRGFAARADPCSYRDRETSTTVDWDAYYEAVKLTGIDWEPPIICNGHMVFKDKERTTEYYNNMLKYLKMIGKGELKPWMLKRYNLFMASMLSVLETYPREDIWFVSPEEIAVEKIEHVHGRCVFLERWRKKK